MGLVKNIDEIKKIRESALLVSKTLGLIAKEIKEGITTLELDKIAINRLNLKFIIGEFT